MYSTTGLAVGAVGNWVATVVKHDYDAPAATLVTPSVAVNSGTNTVTVTFSATNLTALQVVALRDNSDNDQTGLRYYTLDGTVVLGAWGVDPQYAGTGNPYLDMGYAIPAYPAVVSRKNAALLIDVNGNGFPDAGDSLEYEIDVVNVGFASASHVIFEDDLPTNLTTYVSNSAMIAVAGVTNAIPDSLPPKLTRFPFDEGGYDVGTVAIGTMGSSIAATISVGMRIFGRNGPELACE